MRASFQPDRRSPAVAFGPMATRIAGTVLLSVALLVAAAFLAIPLIALFTQVPIGDVPDLLGEQVVRDALAVTAVTNAIANGLILAFGTPLAYVLATRRFRGRSLA